MLKIATATAILLQVLLYPQNPEEPGMVATVGQKFESQEGCVIMSQMYIPGIIQDYFIQKGEMPSDIEFVCVREDNMIPGTEDTHPDR